MAAKFKGRAKIIGDEAPPAALDQSEVARTPNCRYYPAHLGHLDYPVSTMPWMLPGPRHRGLSELLSFIKSGVVQQLTNVDR